MATVKKKVTTKKKVTPKRKVSAKRPPSRKTSLLGASPRYHTFKLEKDIRFFNLRVTRQTIYWSVLLIFILIMQLWILTTQIDVIHTIDAINGR